MTKFIEVSGKTEEEAIRDALEQLGKEREEVSVEVVERAKSGFLGIGGTPAVVRVSYEYTESKAERVKAFLEGLFEQMGTEADMDITEADGAINIVLDGKDPGALIGHRGETLDAIQHLANYAINRGGSGRVRVNIDAGNYRERRNDSLVKLAEKMAAKVVKYRRNMTLEPMNSYERHIIHTALQDYEGVSTFSTGTEPNRRVVVAYEGKQAPKPTYREWR
ncbi:MAG: protein jag [Oscillospiraceae bacterium]|nr:protein jag [Oscillospiraceae bacterium]